MVNSIEMSRSLFKTGMFGCVTPRKCSVCNCLSINIYFIKLYYIFANSVKLLRDIQASFQDLEVWMYDAVQV